MPAPQEGPRPRHTEHKPAAKPKTNLHPIEKWGRRVRNAALLGLGFSLFVNPAVGLGYLSSVLSYIISPSSMLNLAGFAAIGHGVKKVGEPMTKAAKNGKPH